MRSFTMFNTAFFLIFGLFCLFPALDASSSQNDWVKKNQACKKQDYIKPFICDDKIRALSCLECKIQHDYRELKESFSSLKKPIQINNIAEYKALRFIDRGSWEKAVEEQKPIDQIYQPAPKTWKTWLQGDRFNEGLSFDGLKRDNKALIELAKHSLNQDTMKPYSDGFLACPGDIRKTRSVKWNPQ